MTFWVAAGAVLVSIVWAVGAWWVTTRVAARIAEQHAGTTSGDTTVVAATISKRAKWFAIALAAIVGVVFFVTFWNLVSKYPSLVDVALPSAPVVNNPVAPDKELPSKQASGDLNILLKRLEDRMEKEPDDAEGWALLARSYMELKRYPEAAKTYAKASAKLPNEAGLWVEYVDAEVMANERKWTPAAVSAMAKALKLAPMNPKALWLAGTERFENKDYNGAVKHWENLAKIAANDPEYAKEIGPALLEAKALAEGRDPRMALQQANVSIAPVAELSSPSKNKSNDDRTALFGALRLELEGRNALSTSNVSSTNNGPRITGKITVDPALLAQVKPDDTVFVFARAEGNAVNGIGNTPVAVARYAAVAWPIAFSLTEQNSMSPEASLSKVKKVKIVARISHSGDAKAATGDFEGMSDAINVNAENVQIQITRILP
jgi:cytochrome c-type biogenesis protein CcmH